MGDLIKKPGTGDRQGGAGVLEPEPKVSRVAKLAVEQREEWIVTLKDSGASFRRIGEVTEVTKQRAHSIYKRAVVKGAGRYSLDVETRRRDMAVSLMMAIENLEWRVHDDEVPATKDEMDHFIRLNKALAVLLGLEEPKKTTMTHDITMTQDNPQAAEYVADLAAWIKKHEAISVTGNIRPPLPPGMTERAMGQPTAHGHVHAGPGGLGMWSMVVAYPRED